MAFQQYQNNSFQGGNNNSGEPKKKSNFNVGKIYAKGGMVDVGVWCSDKGGTYTTIRVKTGVQDPGSGQILYEQKMSGELPNILLNAEMVDAFLLAVKDKPISQLGNIELDTGRGAKMKVSGMGETVSLTIEHQKNGNRTVTLEPVTLGNATINASWDIFVKYLEIGFKKALTNKLNPDEFQMALSGDSSENDGEAPF